MQILVVAVLTLAWNLSGGLLLEAWTLGVLWRWFAVPAGLPPVSGFTLAGLSLAFIVATHRFDLKTDDTEQAHIRYAATAIARAALCVLSLLVGKVITLWM